MIRRLSARSLFDLIDPGKRRKPRGGGFRAFAGLVFSLIALSLFAYGALAQQQSVTLAISSKENHGRIVVQFNGRSLLPEHSTRISNGVFIVEFKEPIYINVDRVPNKLKDYVSVARSDPDGRGIRFALGRGVKVNTIEAGERLFIDFLPADWQGLPPNLPADVVAEIARRAEEAIRKVEAAERLAEARKKGAVVKLRVGEHPTFSRLRFEWNIPFKSTLERKEKVVTLKFDQAAMPDLSDVTTHLPKGLSGIRAEIDDSKLKVEIKLGDGVDVRAFRNGKAYVMDLTPKAVASTDPANMAVDEALSDGEGGTEQIEAATARSKEQVYPGLPPDAVKKTLRDLTGAEIPDQQSAVAPAAANKPRPPKSPAGLSRGNPEAIPKRRRRRAKFIRVETRRIGKTVRIVFPFVKPVAAAAFRRKKSLWLVFDTPIPIDTRTIRSSLDAIVHDVVIRRSGKATTVRIDLVDPLLTTVGADGSSWIITIGELLLEPSRPLRVFRKVTESGQSKLAVNLKEYALIHQIDDPLVGDQISVVTALGPPRGLIKAQRFAELQTLPSAHGIAVVGYTDDFAVRPDTADTVVFGRGKNGLTLSLGDGAIVSDMRYPKKGQKTVRPGFIDFDGETKSPNILQQNLSRLRNDLSMADEKQRNNVRRRLAKFYLNQKMPFEALGLLTAIGDADSAANKLPNFIVMRAAAQTLAGRVEEALSTLDSAEFENDPDAALWRTIAAARARDWRSAQRAARIAGKVVGEYPYSLQYEFSLAAAESAIEINNFGAAYGYLSEVSREMAPSALAAKYDLLRARVADAAGHSEEALTLLKRTAESRAGTISFEAEYRALRLRYRDGLMPAKQIIERLEQISAGWRGDETELKVLRFLAQLRVEIGEYRKAFDAMKSAVHAAPNADTSRLIHDELTAVFSSLFLDGKADHLPAIDALSLFYDFREMTPVGRQGDEMVRRLASRLVDVDLLDQASQLLQHQVDNRLKGAARAQIAADLATVYLLDRKPERALAVLSKTRQSLLPVGLDRQRRLVEAHAMSESGRPDQANELIRNLSGSDVDRLRADINWKAERWRNAGEQLEKLHSSRWSDRVPLNELERVDILKAAIAYSRADDQIGLDRLNAKFISKMADSSHARAFEVVTRPIETHGVGFIEVARTIAATDSLDAFLDEYRQHYMAGTTAKPKGDVAGT